MLLHPKNLKTHVAASNRGRYALDTIALTRRGSVSTDGRLVLFVPYPDAKPADAPSIPGVNVASPTPDQPVLVRTADAARAAAMVGKGKRGYGSPWTELIQAEIKGDKIAFGATDLSSPQVMTVGRDEGAWPNVGSFLPDMSKASVITLDLDNTLKALKTLRAASNDQEVTVRVLTDKEGVSFSTRDGTALFLMPVVVKAPEDHCPDNLTAFKDQPAPVAVAAPTTVTPDTPASPATEPPTASEGTEGELAEWPDEDEEGDSDDYADGEEYEDDGPIESEMEDAAEVLAKAEAQTPERIEAAPPESVNVQETAVAGAEGSAQAVAEPNVATTPITVEVATPSIPATPSQPAVSEPVTESATAAAVHNEPVAAGV
ncbi:MAG: hypothetical protein IT462_15305 [Planctomycetes bacterium]|nr:hypothetical protein [Planctomycetota bacterium]